MKFTGPVAEYMESEGFSQLYPPQESCVKAGLLDGTSLMVSAPTASGKTLIAILAMVSYLSKNKGKVVYLSPLKALAAEKFAEFKKLKKLDLGRNINVAISTGDVDSIEKNLAKSDILVMTNERMDSIIRHRVDWVEDIGLVIADEIHLIGDETRGPTLEMTLTQLKLLENNPQIIALSATVMNAGAISNWLGCKLIKSDWRPVKLYEGVTDRKTVKMNDGTSFTFKSSVRSPAVDLGVQAVAEGGQSLVFANTRNRSKQMAIKAADAIFPHLTKQEKITLANISKQILEENERTESIKILAKLMKNGVSFHHAGLNQNCRQTVEKAFIDGTIKLISATPTLAAGVNLPARRVVISSVSRYDAKAGMNVPISVLEYKQLCGRAGRPQFDDYGQAIIIGKDNHEELVDRYINGKLEPIRSNITDEKSLRNHLLSVIVTHPGITKDELLDFFMHTFGGRQSRKPIVKIAINQSIEFLLAKEMIVKKGERYASTKFGQKTSRLYIDPLTAHDFKNAIESVSRKNHTLGFLHLITSCEEFFPKLYMREEDYSIIGDIIYTHGNELLKDISAYDYSRSLAGLFYWISEKSEIYMSDRLGIESGDMYRMSEMGERLVYCLQEIASHIGKSNLIEELDVLKLRIAYGVRKELTDLVRIKGVGRVRARALYKHKIKNQEDLAKISVKKLSRIDKIGPVLAEKIKSESRRIRR